MQRETIELSLKIAGLGVAIFGIATYFVDRAESRKDTASRYALELVEEYYQGNVRDSRNVILRFWESNRSSLEQVNKLALTRNELDSVYRSIFLQSGKAEVLVSSIYSVSEFFDRVGFCVTSDVCDPGTIESALCDEGKGFRSKYGTFIDSTRKSLGSYSSVGGDWISENC